MACWLESTGSLGRLQLRCRKHAGFDEAGPDGAADLPAAPGRIRTHEAPRWHPAFSPVLCSGTAATRPRPRPTSLSSGRRTALADWLVRPDHPLTARVIVNRLWQHHFGRGLVGHSQRLRHDGRTSPPIPKLLDWLATRAGCARLELESDAPADRDQCGLPPVVARDCAGPIADPENALLWRQNRRRLDGEAIRDALLAVSGRLNQADGRPIGLSRAAGRAEQA